MEKIVKAATIVFYAMIALWAFSVNFPFLMPILGICAIILLIGSI